MSKVLPRIADPFDQKTGQELLDLLPSIPFYRLNAVIGVYRVRRTKPALDAPAQRDKLDNFISALEVVMGGWQSMPTTVREKLIDAWDQSHSQDGGITWQSPFPLGETVADLHLMHSVAEQVKKEIKPNRKGERDPKYALIRALAASMEAAGMTANARRMDSSLIEAFELILRGLDEAPLKDIDRTVRLALRNSSPKNS